MFNYAKRSFRFQIFGFNLMPWHQAHSEHYEDLIVTFHVAGWLMFQTRWTTIK